MIVELDVILWTIFWILFGILIGVYFSSKYELVKNTCKECGQSLPVEIHRREVKQGQVKINKLLDKAKDN